MGFLTFSLAFNAFIRFAAVELFRMCVLVLVHVLFGCECACESDATIFFTSL